MCPFLNQLVFSPPIYYFKAMEKCEALLAGRSTGRPEVKCTFEFSIRSNVFWARTCLLKFKTRQKWWFRVLVYLWNQNCRCKVKKLKKILGSKRRGLEVWFWTNVHTQKMKALGSGQFLEPKSSSYSLKMRSIFVKAQMFWGLGLQGYAHLFEQVCHF